MATPIDTPVRPEAAPSRVARWRARGRELAGPLVGRVMGLPLWQRLALGIGLAAMIGMGGWLTLSITSVSSEETPFTIADALDRLRAGDLDQARQMAVALESGSRLSYDDRGGPSYVLGMIAAEEAAASPYPDEQRRLYLVSARYLDAAQRDQFPAAATIEAQVQLGESWHHAGRYARALPHLTQALKRRPRNAAHIHRLLASAYYRDTNPQRKLALEHLEKYLADRMLSPAQRQEALVEQARMLIDVGRIDDAQAALERVPEKSKLISAVNVLKARLIMERAARLTTPDQADEAQALWNEAISLLRTPAPRDAVSEQAQREAQLLVGLCYAKLEDHRAAEHQFSRVRRLYIGLPEGTAAALEEADLQRLQGRDEAANELYTEVLQHLGDLRDYSNPWLPLDTLRERLLAAYRHYYTAEKFEVALGFVARLTPIIPYPRVLELQAETNRRWGDRLLADADGRDGVRATSLQRNARSRYHTAAELYYRLSKATRDTREYPDYLWSSADCYRLAGDSHRASRVLRMYLDQHQPQRRANALLALGEAELALHNLEAALSALQELLRDDARHPLSYRARLVASDVYVEQNLFDEARRMLKENLEHEALTPRSIEWRDSLFALAQLLYRQGLELEATSREQGIDEDREDPRKTGLATLEQAAGIFHEAILRLREALARYPDAPQAYEARYTMAECYRQAAKWPRKKLPEISIETTRAALIRQMHEGLHEAQGLYSGLIEDLNERQDKQPLSERQKDVLRNSYFLLADVLFDLEKFPEAIQAYSSATNRYQQRPEALEAFVQIASCYRQLDEPQKARGTLEQAKVVLRRIPADADFDKTTRYSRDEWITLLDFLSSL